MSGHEFKPLSLARQFDPPEGYIGYVGWICGYTADAAFLNDAAERFVGLTNSRRAYEGAMVLALIADPGLPQLSIETVPGILHLPLRNEITKPFRLMHAKVALLGYRAENDDKWLLRLLVSTGNWTRETVEKNLDLVWRLDVKSTELRTRSEPQIRQACADVKAAQSLFEYLRGQYDATTLGAKPREAYAAPWHAKWNDLNQWITRASAYARGIPRFFDNRDRSLLEQLARLVQHHVSPTRRNYLAMGSGFFEKAQDRKSAPLVLQKIVDSLQKKDLLTTANPEIDVFVNPDACQTVAHSLAWMKERRWSVRRPGQPAYFGGTPRALHAKFLFSANSREDSNSCSSPWVYLGSGNLTGPGFDKGMSANGGNLEAGVVLSAGELYWYRESNVADQSLLTNLLPLRWDEESLLNDSPSALKSGPEMPERPVQFIAAPIAWLWWMEPWWLQPEDKNATEYALLDDNRQPCERDERGYFRWPASVRPPQVRVLWKHHGKEWEGLVPVVDEHGRIAAKPLPPLGIDDAWSQLASFPMPPDEEEIPEEGEEKTSPGDDAVRRKAGKSTYPIRSMMEVIENIADKQSSISQFDWPAWCARLEQCLGQAADSEVVQQFRALKLNPLSPLWHTPFRPTYAATSANREGALYEARLRRIEEKWQVADLPRIGGSHESEFPGVEGSSQVS